MIRRDAGRISSSSESSLSDKGFVSAAKEKSLTRKAMSAQEESVLRRERDMMERGLFQEAQETTSSRFGKIGDDGKLSNGTYDVIDTEGKTYSQVMNNLTGVEWPAGVWVIIERVGKDWVISGVSPWQGAE